LVLEADAHPHGGLLAIGGGNDRDDGGRNGPVRIGVEHRGHRHAGGHAADEGFVDVDLDFDRVHVHDGADPGAGKAAARRQWRDHPARLGAGVDHDAAEWRPDLMLLSTAALRWASSRAVSSCEWAWRSCALSMPTRASARVRSASL